MFCAFTRPRYQVSVYRIIGPLVSLCFSRVFVFAMILQIQADHYLLQILMDQLDTFALAVKAHLTFDANILTR